MIPKIIHYCWFGRNPKPESVLKFIQTWKEKMPDYEIKEWNEDNFDVNRLNFTKEAYALKKYAFVSDVARIYALYEEGGIYFDTDIEARRSLTPLLGNKSFVGWEDILPGTGVLASVSKAGWLGAMLAYYRDKHFITTSGKLRMKPNPYVLTEILKQYGLKLNHGKDLLKDDIVVYPIDYLCAHDMSKREFVITGNTYCVHHFEASWCGKKKLGLCRLLAENFGNIVVRARTAFAKSVVDK